MTENHTAYWPDEEDPLAQVHGFGKVKRAEMRLFAALVLTLKLQGQAQEAEFIERAMAAPPHDIYGTKSWDDAQSYVQAKLPQLAVTARERMKAAQA